MKTFNFNKRGQVTTVDLIIASIIFVVILLTALFYWNDVLLRIKRFEDKDSITKKALDVSEMLVTSPGKPSNWHTLSGTQVNKENVSFLGFAKEDNVLDPEKLDRMGETEYDNVKEILGLSKEEFNITIVNSSGGVIYSFGQSYNQTNVLIKRYVLLDGDLMEFRAVLFYNSSTNVA